MIVANCADGIDSRLGRLGFAALGLDELSPAFRVSDFVHGFGFPPNGGGQGALDQVRFGPDSFADWPGDAGGGPADDLHFASDFAEYDISVFEGRGGVRSEGQAVAVGISHDSGTSACT